MKKLTNNKDDRFVEFYISVDVESTGPIPGEYSMSSFGAFAAGARTASGVIAGFQWRDELDGAGNKFYRELKPISDRFDPQAIQIGLLEGFSTVDPTGRAHHQWQVEHGHEPADAMESFSNWVQGLSNELGGARPVFVGYPAGFDWMFLYWYLIKFTGASPFGFSGMIDLKSTYAALHGVSLGKATKRSMARSLLKSDVPHDHHALHDAIGQGHLAINILRLQSGSRDQA